ncbi:hypothetical protein [Pseudomonas phage PA1C]|uniref:Uncharacterized protein n=1 Tax=Pseudomonas phage vB_PaeM_PS119XW TaxID=2601632 RepID=A0A5C1K6U7_9CAUD|nr:hypothetical protein PP933_gp078 [Pseudomonas phage vB_PaeM_PS119XW]QBX32229.1 hypothetical protein [Pseudomonas phage PA1C]QEM41807.1 hypothetical protein [Pseudomonas phage vB_PaeM_PS119XW]BEG72716.1 hypothetical protein RVBP21_3440 [Pseudomonas phage BRkr]
METIMLIWWISISIIAGSLFVAKLVKDNDDVRRTRLPKKDIIMLDRINMICTALIWGAAIVALITLFLGGLFMMIEAQV